MLTYKKLFLFSTVLMVSAACQHSQSGAADPCNQQWYQRVETATTTSDNQAHGPDLGSLEWRSVVEFKLGIRGQAGIPDKATEEWCRFIEDYLQKHPVAGQSSGPSFDCRQVTPASVEELVCRDSELSGLDQELNLVYQQALIKAVNEQPPRLQAEQRGWIKGRDECWKGDDKAHCVHLEYRRRIAELQARYRLVAFSGPDIYTCSGDPRNELVVTRFDTEPQTLMVERGDRVSLMFQQNNGEDAGFRGRNESFRDNGPGIATVVWGYQAAAMECSKQHQSIGN